MVSSGAVLFFIFHRSIDFIEALGPNFNQQIAKTDSIADTDFSCPIRTDTVYFISGMGSGMEKKYKRA